MLQIQAPDASAQQIRILQSVSPETDRVTESRHQSEEEEKVALRGIAWLYFLPSSIDLYMNISDLINILACLVVCTTLMLCLKHFLPFNLLITACFHLVFCK